MAMPKSDKQTENTDIGTFRAKLFYWQLLVVGDISLLSILTPSCFKLQVNSMASVGSSMTDL